MISVAVSAGPVSNCATIRTLPRTVSAEPEPAPGVLIVASDWSSDVQTIGVPGIAPDGPLAIAVKLNVLPAPTASWRGEMRSMVAVAPGPV